MRSKMKRVLVSLKVTVDGQWVKYFVILWMALSFGYDVRSTVYFSLLWEVVVKKPVLWVLISDPLLRLLSRPALHFSWTAAVACWQSPAAILLPPTESLHPPGNLLRASPVLEPRSPHHGLQSVIGPPCFAVAGMQQAYFVVGPLLVPLSRMLFHSLLPHFLSILGYMLPPPRAFSDYPPSDWSPVPLLCLLACCGPSCYPMYYIC